MFDWKKVNNRRDMPQDGRSFLAVWKGRISVAQYDTDDDLFCICFDPVDYCMMLIPRDREGKFNYWSEMPANPQDVVTNE